MPDEKNAPKRLNIDLAKGIFQICEINSNNKTLFNRGTSRTKLLIEFLNCKADMIIMESCYSSTYWGRLYKSQSFKVRLIPAQHVKPFVNGNKNGNIEDKIKKIYQSKKTLQIS